MTTLWSRLKTYWQQRHQLGDERVDESMQAFLPAALEIQETPANPLAKWLARTLLLLFVIGLIWSMVGEVDVVASAEGKIVPSSRVKHIQPLEKAVIKQIFVKEGELVEAGQLMVELDTTATQADASRLEHQLESAQQRRAAGQLFLQLLAQPQTVTELSATIAPGTLAQIPSFQHRQWVTQRWQQHVAQHQELLYAMARTEAEHKATQANVRKLERTLPLVSQRAKAVKRLRQQQFVSEVEYLQLEQERIQIAQDLLAERQRLIQFQSEQNRVEAQLQTLKSQTQSSELAELMSLEENISALHEELTKARDLNIKRLLTSPVSGRVQNLSINTIGGVVTDAQQIMSIVPEHDALEVEVYLENKDIGFVYENMMAEVKVHTFPFTKYGVVQGSIDTVARDSVIEENRGLLYQINLTLSDAKLKFNERSYSLSPGMAVTVEFKLGKRHLIDFFLTPLLENTKESLRER